MEDSLTLLLTQAQEGDLGAERRAMPLVYDRLCAIASTLMRGERDGHTLQRTALVSEFFVQKFRRFMTPLQNREHFYSMAASAMRQVLTDHARHNRALRRNRSPENVAELLTHVENSPCFGEEHLAVQQVFRALARLDPEVSECVRLHVVLGLTFQQIGKQRNLPAWKVRAFHDFGLKWMADRLGGSR